MTKEERVAEALRKRQEIADLQRQKMDEERKKQIDFVKAGKDSMSTCVCVCVCVRAHAGTCARMCVGVCL